MVRVVGGKGFVNVDQPIIIVYEGVTEVGLGVEFRLIGGNAEEEKKRGGRNGSFFFSRFSREMVLMKAGATP